MGVACTSTPLSKPNAHVDVFESSAARFKHSISGASRKLLQDEQPSHAWVANHPKVGLAFLSMGTFPQEETWRLWFQAAHNQVALAPLQQGGCTKETLAQAIGTAPGARANTHPIADQDLFSVYVHVPNGVHYSLESTFAPYVLGTRLDTQWGTHSITDAMRAILAEGLKDERNQVFVTVSDDAMPLRHPTVFYQSAIHFPVSRINACLGNERTTGRWREAMANKAAYPVRLEDWRKSSQWFQIQRHHAERLVEDQAIDHTFRNYCTENADQPACTSDEHYPATTLSMLGHTLETDCQGSIMATDWSDGGSHPSTFQEDAITFEFLDKIAETSGCHPKLAYQLASYGFVQRGSNLEAAYAACESAPLWQNSLLGSSCPLMSRKFDKSTDLHVARWLKHRFRRAEKWSLEAKLSSTRTEVLANATVIHDIAYSAFFPESGCASTRRDYVWPRGVFMDFTCPTRKVGDATMIEALRCWAERPVCEAVISEKKRFFDVDSAFQDTLEGGDAMNDGIRLLRTLLVSSKPKLHRDVTKRVMDIVRASDLSIPFYVQDFEIIRPEQRVALLSILWFVGEVPYDQTNEPFLYFSNMLKRMVGNPAALEIAIEAAVQKKLLPFPLPSEDFTAFESTAQLAEVLSRSLSEVTMERLNQASGAPPARVPTTPKRLGDVVHMAAARVQEAHELPYNIGWVTSRPDGFGMLAAIMATQALGRDTRESAARLETLQMATEAMQPSQSHMHVARDLSVLCALAQTLATAH